MDLLWKGVEAVGFLSVGERHPHPGGERRVKDHGGTLEPRRKVYRGHRADALSVQDDVLRTNAIPETQILTFQNKRKTSGCHRLIKFQI